MGYARGWKTFVLEFLCLQCLHSGASFCLVCIYSGATNQELAPRARESRPVGWRPP